MSYDVTLETMNGRLYVLVTPTQVHQFTQNTLNIFFVPQAISDITNNLAIEQEIPSYIMYLIYLIELLNKRSLIISCILLSY